MSPLIVNSLSVFDFICQNCPEKLAHNACVYAVVGF
jgi:hypothetical protein